MSITTKARNILTLPGFVAYLALLVLPASVKAQVHYHPNGQPWVQRAASGPDAEVPGWFYNLGITGLRAQLVTNAPKALLVKYVFANTPASGLVEIGDFITGAGGKPFLHEHRNGYGMKVFGADGPISEFADALEACQGGVGKGKLALTLRRGTETKEVALNVGQKYGAYSATYPANCLKSERILSELLQYLADRHDHCPRRDVVCVDAALRHQDRSHRPRRSLRIPKESHRPQWLCLV
jgi:hypothetical protein